MSIVVSDTSPIRALDWIGRLDLLPRLYGTVLVPPTVASELLNTGPRFRRIDVTMISGLEVRYSVGSIPLAAVQPLDAGEAEALTLAIEIGATHVLIDESDGRRAAGELGLIAVGTLGILLQAKDRGLVELIGPLIQSLRDGLGFFLSDFIVAYALEQAGESETQTS